jgi:iron complex outermembrane receptor protein
MTKLFNALLVGGSTAAIVAGASLFATKALAQPAADAAAPVEQVTVTGTSIRGVATVGSNLITVDPKTIEQTGATSAQQLLQTVSAISSDNGPPQGENAYSYYAPQIHDLAGSASNSTLVIVDGLRLPGGGQQGYVETDPNIIPTIAIERVEVLADGASSIYGSDAVAGVVNFITRKGYDGLQVNFQEGVADQYNNTYLGVLWGTHTNDTSVMVALGYTYSSRLAQSARSFTSMGDYTPLGGNKFAETFGCPVAAVSVPGNANLYLTPQSTAAVANNIPNRNCNTTVYGDLLPSSTRENALFKVSHDFSDRLTSTMMLDVNSLKTVRLLAPGSLSNATVYGPGSGKGGQINPFYQAPAGAPAATQESATWVDLMGQGANGAYYGRGITQEDTFYGTWVTTYKLTSEWEAKLSDSLSYNHNISGNANAFCSSCALLALNGTAQTSGSTTASDISSQNTITLNLPLTANNALDIWDPAGSTNKTSTAVQQSLYRGESYANDYTMHNQLKLDIDGPIFDLPAGPVKAAIGGEWQNWHLTHNAAGSNGTGSLLLGQQNLFFHYSRAILSAYAEINAPLISPDMHVPLVQAFNVDISGRYDNYSDVGQTSNPKFAADWTIVDGIKLRGNYSTSFVAPPMGVLGDPALGGEYSAGASVTNGGLVVPVGAYPTVTQLPGCAGATVTCTLPSSDQGLNRQFGGLLSNIKPQTGNGWSLGIDAAPAFLPGFSANATLFNNAFKGGVTNGSFALHTSTPSLQYKFQVYPSCATQAQIDAFTRVPNGAIFNGTIPSCVLFTWNHDEINLLDLHIQGVDLNLAYNFDTAWGSFEIGSSATIFTEFRQDAAGGPQFSILNTVGLNVTFPSVQTQMRTHVSWSQGPFEGTLFWNYTSGYRYVGGTQIAPIITDSNGNFVSGGDAVKANNTFDVHAAYNFENGWLSGDQLYFDVKNIFDQDPPFINGNTAGIGIGSPGYDGFISNPIGRMVSVGVRANF